jgi:hypothetical protein
LGLDTAVDYNKNPKAIGYDGMWVTNPISPTVPTPQGISNQRDVSLGKYGIGGDGVWTGNPQSQIDGFRAFYHMSLQFPTFPGEATSVAIANTNLAMQMPYTPLTNVYQYITWQANDPLVHYLAGDLTDTKPFSPPISPLINPNVPNDRYQPWNWAGGQMTSMGAAIDQSSVNLAFKDPRVYSSDYWDFPTNKFPTVGWLGRVHRGTPWQTVYLKTSDILAEQDPTLMKAANYGINTWVNWTGDSQLTTRNQYFDAANTAPTQDRILFDLFTTAPNDNATRGQLPVNQQNFAAWSALFSGMVVPTSLAGASTVISPAGTNGVNSAVYKLFDSISAARSGFKNPNGAFTHIGDVLSASALTEKSPFLAGLNPTNGISDELYEWLPQQMMSLLKISTEPRYVIYSHGQTLEPAGANAILSGGNFAGMVTNYQVVAETISRAVVDIVGAPTNTHIRVESFNLLPPK